MSPLRWDDPIPTPSDIPAIMIFWLVILVVLLLVEGR